MGGGEGRGDGEGRGEGAGGLKGARMTVVTVLNGELIPDRTYLNLH